MLALSAQSSVYRLFEPVIRKPEIFEAIASALVNVLFMMVGTQLIWYALKGPLLLAQLFSAWKEKNGRLSNGYIQSLIIFNTECVGGLVNLAYM